MPTDYNVSTYWSQLIFLWILIEYNGYNGLMIYKNLPQPQYNRY